MDKGLPVHHLGQPGKPALQRRRVYFKPALAALVFASLCLSLQYDLWLTLRTSNPTVRVAFNTEDVTARCKALNVTPAPPPDFSARTQSDRYEAGTLAVLIRNATIWTGNEGGTETFTGDILLDMGLIKEIGTNVAVNDDVTIIDAEGAWVTPGYEDFISSVPLNNTIPSIVDVHAHNGVMSSPLLAGATDTDSHKALAQPWLRSLDGMNTHDDSYALSIAGGVTTSLVLPGSDTAISGQAFTMKLRPTKERSSSSLLVAPPYGLNGSDIDYSIPPLWRHMKHACGENPSKYMSGVRMDTVWSYRDTYNKGRLLKEKQDEYCAKLLNGGSVEGLGSFPDDMQWESLVDTLRGKVKVHVHCYEAVDLDAFVRLTNEFKFPVAAFHHAHEAYLVTDLLKKAYNNTPATPMFGSFARYKREGYRHSTYAPRILHDEGIDVIMKSDTPAAIASRWLLHEAQQAHYYGLPANASLASVTTTAAKLLGLDYRLGYIKQGYDADVVIWDSHPLTLGATPIQVFIDGISQMSNVVNRKKTDFQDPPDTPNFDEEAKAAVEYVGLPPLEPKDTQTNVIFRNATSIWIRGTTGAELVYAASGPTDEAVLVFDGTIVCAGSKDECLSDNSEDFVIEDLQRGSIMPALTSVGTAIGLHEIALEPTTSDGAVDDPLLGSVPSLFSDGVVRAYDGLIFGTRDALLAYRAGVTSSITVPITPATGDNLNVGFIEGLSTFFSLGGKHKLETCEPQPGQVKYKCPIIKEEAALHVGVLHRSSGASVSTQIGTLRNLLIHTDNSTDRGRRFGAVANGTLTLAVDAKNADIIASLLDLKAEVEAHTGKQLKLTIVGGAEAHLLAPQLAAANVGVIVTPVRSFPFYWEGRRALAGPPLTEDNLLTTLIKNNVTVGIGHQGVEEVIMLTGWAAHNMRWDAAWVSIDAPDVIDTATALNIASTNIEALLGVTRDPNTVDLVATMGSDLFSFESKVVAIISSVRGVVDIF